MRKDILNFLSSLRRWLPPAGVMLIGFTGSIPCAQATTLFWDADGAATTGFTTSATGTWGTSLFWSTDVNGSTAGVNTPTTSLDDVNFGSATSGFSAASTVTISGAQNVNSITFGEGNTANLTISGGTSLTLGSTSTITVATGRQLLINTTPLAGTNGFTKLGAGELRLESANTYTGGTNINAGTLTIGNAAALGSSGTISFGGGTLQYSGITTDLSSRFSTAASQAYNINTNGQNVTLASALSSNGGILTKSGTGTLTLTGANAYTGTTTISGGALSFGGNASSMVSSALTVGSGTTLNFGSASEAPNLTINPVGGFGLNAFGNVNVAGGTITIAGPTDGLVLQSTNTYTQTGGAVTTNGFMEFANGGTSSISTVNISGGSLTSTNGTVNATNLAVRGTSTVNLSGTGTLTASTLNMTTNQLSGGAAGSTVNLNGGTLVTGRIIKGLNGTTGTQTFNFNGGTLKASATSATYMTGLTNAFVKAGGAVIDTQAFNVTIGQNLLTDAVSTGGGLTKAGTGTLTLTGTNTYSGLTTVNAGTLAFGSSDSLFSGNALTLGASGLATFANAGQTLGAVSNANTTSNALNFSATTGTVTLASLSGAGNTTFGSLASIGTLSAGTVNLNGATSTITTLNGGTINLGAATALTVSSGTSSGGITGTGGSLIKTSSGTLTLNGANSYTGTTTVSSGVLNIQNATGLGTTAGGTSVASGAALQLQGGISVGAEALTLSGTGVSSDGALRNISGTNTYGGLVTLGGATRINSDAGTLTLSNAGTITGSGFDLTLGGAGNMTVTSIIGTGSGNLIKDGAGTVTLSGANTFTGTTTINAGTLKLGVINALDSTSAIILANAPGVVLDLNGFNVSIASLSGGGNLGGSVSLGASTLTTGADNSSTTYATNLSGGGGITKTGTGVFTLSGTNSYIGATTVNGGTLQAGSTTAFGNGSAVTLANTSGVVLDLNNNAITVGSLAGGGTNGGNVTLGSGTLTAGGDNSNTNFDGLISGTGGLTKAGSGTLTLTAANAYTGLTNVNAGTLSVGSGGSLASGNTLTLGGSGLATFANAGQTLGAVANANTATNALNFTASTGTVTLDSLSGAGNTTFGSNGTVTGGISAGTVTSTGHLTANISGGTTTVGGLLTGNISSGTVSAGSLSATTVSGGTNTITGAAGITTVSNGTTTVGGVATIGTLSGGTANLNGATSAVTTLNGGTVNLGSSTALTVSNGTSSGLITSTGGSLTKTSSGTLTLNGTNTYTGGTTIGAGTVNFTTGGLGTTGAVTFSGNSTLQYGASTTTDLSSRLAIGNGVTGTIDTNGNTVTFATGFGASGSGALTKAGTGTLSLNGTNTYSGLTTVNSGTLAIGSIGSLASGNALTLGASGLATFANAGQTLGAVTNDNTATNALNFGASSGTVTLASLSGAGSTRFGSDGIVTGGISAGTVSSVGNLTANISGGTSTVGGLLTGNISAGTVGAGSLSATTVSGGVNTITGAAGITTISSGTTTVGGVATIGTLTGGTVNLNGSTSAITTLNGGTVNLGSSTALTVNGGTSAGAITGTGGQLVKVGTGSLTLTGANTYTGASTISAGTLSLQATSGAALANTSALAIGSEATLELGAANQINSSANLSLTGGTLALHGFNQTLGTLTLGANSAIDLTGSATLVFADSSGLNWNSALLSISNFSPTTNSLRFGLTGSGLDANQLSLIRFVEFGNSAARIDANGFLAPLNINFTNTGATNFVLSNPITGTTTVDQSGSGSTTLTAPGSSPNTSTGAATVSAGTLVIGTAAGGNWHGNVTVSGSGTLKGRGDIDGEVIVNAGGNYSPGNSPAIQHLGSLTVNMGGFVTIELDGATAGIGAGFHDQVISAGAVTLNGGTLNGQTIFSGSSGYLPTIGAVHAVITGSTVTGKFADYTFDSATNAAGITWLPEYTSTAVNLYAVPSDFGTAVAGLNANQTQVGAALQSLRLVGTFELDQRTARDSRATLFNGLKTKDAAGLRTAYDQLTPEKLTALAASTFQSTSILNSSLQQRSAELRRFGPASVSLNGVATPSTAEDSRVETVIEDGVQYQIAKAKPQKRYGYFALATGAFASVDGSSDRLGSFSQTGAATAGVDYALNQNQTVGLVVSQASADTDFSSNSGSSRTATSRVGLFHDYHNEGFFLNASVSAGFSAYDSKRKIAFLNQTASGETQGLSCGGQLSTGYDFKVGKFLVGPTASVAYDHAQIDGFDETGSAADLKVGKQKSNSLVTQLGLQVSRPLVWQRIGWIPDVRLGVSRQHYNPESIRAQFAAGGGEFKVKPQAGGSEYINPGASLSALLPNGWTVRISYDAILNPQSTEHRVNLSLNAGF